MTACDLERLERDVSRVMSSQPRDDVAMAVVLQEVADAARSHPGAAELFDMSYLLDELAFCYQRLGRTDNALEAMRQALAAGWSGEPDGRCRLAEILMGGGRVAEAAPIWAAVKADTPHDVWLYNNAGLEYQFVGDHETALGWLTEGLALALRTGDPEGLVGQLADARVVSLTALGRQPDELDEQADAFIARMTGSAPALSGSSLVQVAEPDSVTDPYALPAQLPEQGWKAGDSRALLLGVGQFAGSGPTDEELPLDRPIRPPLDFVGPVLPRVEQAFGGLGYQVTARLDPDRSELVDAVTQTLDEDVCCLVVHVVSHGEVGDDRDRLDVVPACGRTGVGTNVSDWLSIAQQRRSPVLFLLDLCRSGRTARLPWLTERAGRDTNAWVIAGAGPDEDAFDGRFSVSVATVLTQLACDGLGTDPGRRYVSFQTVARRIGEQVEAMPGLPQLVHATPLDPAQQPPELPFFPNPRYIDDPQRAARQAIESPLRGFLDDLDDVFDVEHFLGRVGSHFAGRRHQLRELAPWLDGIAAGGLRVVTGSPGVGKSALLGALVCAAHPVLADAVPQIRARLDPDDACPSRNDTLAAVHARQRRLSELMASLGRQLQLDAPEEGWTTAALVDAVGALPVTPVIVVDALDEALDPAGVMRVLLLPLTAAQRPDGTAACRLLVGMRPWPEFAALRDLAIESGGLLDLDTVDPDELRADLKNYLAARLADLSDYKSPVQRQVRERLAGTVAAKLTTPEIDSARPEWGAFLVAGIFARYLDGVPPATDPAAAERLGATVPRSLPAVLELDLGVRPERRECRAVLAAFAYAKGEGMPAEVAGLIASGFIATDGDDLNVGALIDAGRFYFRTTIERDGTTLYRLFHQGLADYLRRHPVHAPKHDAEPEPETSAPPYAGLVLDQLLSATIGGEAGRWRSATPYLLRHAIQHAAEAGRVDGLLTDPAFLVHADPATLIPELYRAEAPRARLAAAVYRASAGKHRCIEPDYRRRLLSIDAARYGSPELAHRFSADAAVGSWQPRWATGALVHPALRDTLIGHSDRVTVVACITINGRPAAVTGSADHTLRVWDLITGQPLGAPVTIQRRINALACTTVNGRPIAVTDSGDGVTVRLWDLITGQPIGKPLTGHIGSIYAVACTSLNNRPVAVTGGFDCSVLVWDLTTGRRLRELLGGHTSTIRAIACTTIDDRPVAVSGDDKGELCVCDLTTGNYIDLALTGHTDKINAVACLSVEGRPAAVTSSDDGTARVWDLTTGESLGPPLTGHDGRIDTVTCTSVEGRPVAITGEMDNARVWDLTTGQPLGTSLTAHTAVIYELDCTTINGRPVAISVSWDGTARVWDLAGDRSLGAPQPGHTDMIAAVACTTVEGRPVAVTTGGRDGGDDDTVRLWDLTTGRPLSSPLTGHDGPVWTVACTILNGRPVAVTASEDRTVRLWDLTTRRPLGNPLTGRTGPVWAVACTTLNGRPIAVTASDDSTVRLWDLTTRQLLGTPLTGHTNSIWSIDCTTVNGRPVAVTGSADNTARVWDLTTGQAIGAPVTHTDWVHNVACTTIDGRPVAVTNDGKPWVWDLTTRQIIRDLPTDYLGKIHAMACAHVDGRPLAITGGDEGTVRVWELTTGHCLDVLPMPAQVIAVSVADDGALVVCCDRDVVVLDQVRLQRT